VWVFYGLWAFAFVILKRVSGSETWERVLTRGFLLFWWGVSSGWTWGLFCFAELLWETGKGRGVGLFGGGGVGGGNGILGDHSVSFFVGLGGLVGGTENSGGVVSIWGNLGPD